ncbi:hypothetical protein ASD36_18300 [Rhizobium sp. Root1334]|nr:hypothetical protein ASD36_18300 [Rhizobium sp. Root1334]
MRGLVAYSACKLPQAPTSPQRGEVPSESEVMRGPFRTLRNGRTAPSSGPAGHLLPAGEKRKQAAARLPSSTYLLNMEIAP